MRPMDTHNSGFLVYSSRVSGVFCCHGTAAWQRAIYSEAATVYVMSDVAPGWYSDPTNPVKERPVDGSEWIDRVRVRAPFPAAQPVPVEMPPPPPVQQPVVYSSPPPERDYENRVKVVKSTLWVTGSQPPCI